MVIVTGVALLLTVIVGALSEVTVFMAFSFSTVAPSGLPVKPSPAMSSTVTSLMAWV